MLFFFHLVILLLPQFFPAFLKNEFDSKLINLHQMEYDNYKSYFIAGGIFNVYYFWLINGSKESPKELANKMVDLLEK